MPSRAPKELANVQAGVQPTKRTLSDRAIAHFFRWAFNSETLSNLGNEAAVERCEFRELTGICNERAMTAPRARFSTHQCDAVLVRQLDQCFATLIAGTHSSNKTSLPESLKKAGLRYVHMPGRGSLRHAARRFHQHGLAKCVLPRLCRLHADV